jgi:hypothetical protein
MAFACHNISTDYDQITADLKKDGVVVINNILPFAKCNDLISQTIAGFSKINPALDVNNIRETWTKPNLPPQTRTGMFQSIVCNLDPIIEVRENPDLIKLFKEIYSRLRSEPIDELVCSIDGINIKPNELGPYKNPISKDWAHIDQTSRGEPYKCLQGQMVLANTSAAFRCSPRSHLIYDKILATCGISAEDKTNWGIIPRDKYSKCKELVESVGGKWQIPVIVPAGSFIIWLSSTIHSAVHSDKKENPRQDQPWFGWRAVYYITYRPKNEFTAKQLDRIEINKANNRVMNHWTTKLFPKGSRFTPTKDYHENIQKYIIEPKLVYDVLAA